ncbi:transposase Tn3 family protein [Burkholderia sp. BT03]|nr:transposase Tn3 family protein [Burkholderia sp. BT03]
MHGGMVNQNSSLGHHLLEVAQTQRIRNIPAHAEKHYIKRKCSRMSTFATAGFRFCVIYQTVRHRDFRIADRLLRQSRTISSPLLLRRLGSESRKNRLYLAARELGNVVRTVFLLEWIGSRELRQEVTANTNKIESYNGFAKWLSFGGDVIAENEPEEQQKRLRYNDLIASAVILQNTVDKMRALRDMVAEGEMVRAEDIGFLSPYPTHNIRRFRRYRLHLDRSPESWIKDALFGQAARPDDEMR